MANRNCDRLLSLYCFGMLAVPMPTLGGPLEQRMNALEKRLIEMEQRLRQSEADNTRLRQQLEGPARAPMEPAAPVAAAGTDGATPTAKALEQKVSVIERRLEIQKEESDTAKKSAVKVEAGPDTGFRITSADGAHQLRLQGYAQIDGNFFADDDARDDIGIGLNSSGKPNRIAEGTGLGIDKFTARRVRLQVGGTLFKYTDFLIGADFGGGQSRVFDAFLDQHLLPFASLAVGKMRGAGTSLERLQAAPHLWFVERAYPTQLTPNREIGVMLHGEFGYPGFNPQYRGPLNINNFLTYQVGVYNGSPDNQAVQNVDNISFDNKAFEGRVFAHPFQKTGISSLSGLGLGVSGTYGNPTRLTGLPSLVSPGQNPILAYATGNSQTSASRAVAVTQPNTPATGQQTVTTTTTTQSSSFSAALADGEQYRIAPQAYWLWGPFGLLAEYAYSSTPLAVQRTDTTTIAVQTAVRRNLAANTTRTLASVATSSVAGQPRIRDQTRQDNHAWQIAMSYVLTGENNSLLGIRPEHPFDPLNGEWGALQLAARWTELDIDRDTFRNFGTATKPVYLFADPRASVQHAQSWAVGLNWWLNQNIKFMADYEQTRFDGGAVNGARQVVDRPDEKVFFTRFQFSY